MSRLRPFVPVLTLGVLSALLIPQSVVAWEFTERGDGSAFDQALAVALRGHVFVGGRINDDAFAVKVHREHGTAMWRYHPVGSVPGSERASAAAIDPAGHPIFAGVTTEEDTVNRGRFTVVKIDKDTGVPHWITRVDRGNASAVAVDAAGDVIAAGVLGDDMGIVKIRGTDGVELWRAQPRDAAPLGQARALALDSAGNAVAVGTLRPGEFEAASCGATRLRGMSSVEEMRRSASRWMALAMWSLWEPCASSSTTIFRASSPSSSWQARRALCCGATMSPTVCPPAMAPQQWHLSCSGCGGRCGRRRDHRCDPRCDQTRRRNRQRAVAPYGRPATITVLRASG
jgi:hypothetical protein